MKAEKYMQILHTLFQFSLLFKNTANRYKPSLECKATKTH